MADLRIQKKPMETCKTVQVIKLPEIENWAGNIIVAWTQQWQLIVVPFMVSDNQLPQLLTKVINSDTKTLLYWIRINPAKDWWTLVIIKQDNGQYLTIINVASPQLTDGNKTCAISCTFFLWENASFRARSGKVRMELFS